MGQILSNTIFSGTLTIIIYFSGIWLRKKGEPYHTGIFTLHKLSVLAVLVLLVLNVLKHLRIIEFQGLGLTVFVVASVFFVIAFITGALLSIKKTSRYFVKTIHRISSVLIVLMIPVIWFICH